MSINNGEGGGGGGMEKKEMRVHNGGMKQKRGK